MERRLPTFEQLSYLVALHDTNHFGQAALLRQVSQSTISSSLVALEGLLEATLVERTSRWVRFTPMGETIVSRARTVLRDAAHMLAVVDSA